MAEEYEDAVARDTAMRALTLVEKHVAVCAERDKSEEAFQRRTEEWLRRMQQAYETAVADIRDSISDAVNRLQQEMIAGRESLRSEMLSARESLRAELMKHGQEDIAALRELSEARSRTEIRTAKMISDATRPLYDRFWTLSVSLAAGLLGLVGVLFGKLEHWF